MMLVDKVREGVRSYLSRRRCVMRAKRDRITDVCMLNHKNGWELLPMSRDARRLLVHYVMADQEPRDGRFFTSYDFGVVVCQRLEEKHKFRILREGDV